MIGREHRQDVAEDGETRRKGWGAPCAPDRGDLVRHPAGQTFPSTARRGDGGQSGRRAGSRRMNAGRVGTGNPPPRSAAPHYETTGRKFTHALPVGAHDAPKLGKNADLPTPRGGRRPPTILAGQTVQVPFMNLTRFSCSRGPVFRTDRSAWLSF